MNAEPRFVLGHLVDGDVPVIVRPMTPDSFELVTIKLRRDYQQIEVLGFPPVFRSGAPKLIAKDERAVLFRCEALQLLSLGACDKIHPHGFFLIFEGSSPGSRSFEVSLGDLFDWIEGELKSMLAAVFTFLPSDFRSVSKLRRNYYIRTRSAGPPRIEMVSLGSLLDFLEVEIKAALLAEGWVAQEEIDARAVRQREVARRGGPEIKVVQ